MPQHNGTVCVCWKHATNFLSLKSKHLTVKILKNYSKLGVITKMPQVVVQNCETLLKTCIEYVKNNMDFWCKPPNEIDVSTPEYISPFEILRKFPIVPSRAQFFKQKLNNCLFL